MELLRERFLSTYANLPLTVREEIVLVFEDQDKIKKTLTWNVIYLEISQKTDRSEELLRELDSLGFI